MNNHKRFGPRKKGKGRRVVEVTVLPKQIETNPVFTKTFRYEAGAAESKDADVVTWASLQALMFNGVTGTTGNFVFGGVRLRKIELWVTANGTASDAHGRCYALG
jgi:hypothetical protein